MECKKCNKSIRNKNFIHCDGVCGGIFHTSAECADITEYDIALLQKKQNILFMCDECIQNMRSVAEKIECMLKLLKESKDQMSKQESEMKEILVCVKKVANNENIMDEIKKVCANNKSTVTFASTVKSSAPVLIKPKQKQNQNKTREDLRKNVNPAGFKISDVKGAQNGVVSIRCEDEADSDKMKQKLEEKMGKDYEVKLLSLRMPKVCVCDLDTEYDEETVVKKLKEQNECIKNSKMKCVRVYEKSALKSKVKLYNAIVEIDTDGFNKLMEVQKVSLGWNRCRVYDCINVKRCFKCLGFNHKSTECSLNQVCAKCLGSHKKEDICQEVNKVMCINCIRVNKKLSLNIDTEHYTFSRECPVYIRKLQIEKQKIKY